MKCAIACTAFCRSHDCICVPFFCLYPPCSARLLVCSFARLLVCSFADLFSSLFLFSFVLGYGHSCVSLVCVFIHNLHFTGVYYFLHINLNIAMQAPSQPAAHIPLSFRSAIYENKYFVNETTTCSWHHSLLLISSLHPVTCRKLQLLQWILLLGHPPRPSCSASTPRQMTPTWQCWHGKYGTQKSQDPNLRACQCREQISCLSQIQLPVDRHLICKPSWCHNGMLH